MALLRSKSSGIYDKTFRCLINNLSIPSHLMDQIKELCYSLVALIFINLKWWHKLFYKLVLNWEEKSYICLISRLPKGWIAHCISKADNDGCKSESNMSPSKDHAWTRSARFSWVAEFLFFSQIFFGLPQSNILQ